MKNNKPEIARLESDIRLHRYLYYNKQPRISDAAFDALMERLRQLDSNSQVLLETGAPTSKDSGWQKAPHLMKMFSLQNAMSVPEFNDWCKRTGVVGRVCVTEDKFDGLSVELIYDNGKLVQGLTRGDGRTGEDITINVLRMKYVQKDIPEKIKASVRGEIILLKKDFETINALQTTDKKYANPRNAASGICKRFDGEGCEMLCIVVYDIVSDDVTFSFETEKMDYLSHTLKMVTANYKLISPQEVIRVREQYTTSDREKLPYNIDGLVIKLNSIQKQKDLGLHPGGDPKAQIAFKFDARGVATTLRDIILTVGRTGVITPNAVIEPVNIDGSMVKAASLHNFDEIERLKVGIGDTILVIKAGEIIPKVTEVIQSAGKPYKIPTECPMCHGPVTKVKKDDGSEGVSLICTSNECEGKEFRKIRHFVDVLKKRMGMDSLGESTIQQLFDKNIIKDPADFFILTANNIAGLDRMGEKSAKKITDGLDRCKEMDLVTFLCALAIPSLGETMAELIADEYDLGTLMEEVTVDDLAKISGIGSSRAKEIVEGLEQRQPLIEKLMASGIKIRKAQAVKTESNKLQGKSFQVTGAFSKVNPKTNKPYKREEWYELVQAHGGTISRVNKDLNFLVAIKSNSNKIAKAQTLGIKMISEDEFWAMVD